jgi:hypothetical protein
VTTEAPPCVHHDKIEMPHGPISIGRCKKCGREREYQNYRFAYDYNNRPIHKTPIPYQQEQIWDE